MTMDMIQRSGQDLVRYLVFNTDMRGVGCCSVSVTLLGFHGWSLPGPSVHGILQARILEWVAFFFSRGSSWPRDQTWVSCIGRWILHQWSTREAQIAGTNSEIPNLSAARSHYWKLRISFKSLAPGILNWNCRQNLNHELVSVRAE